MGTQSTWGQKASIVSRGNMSQKSISSFFSKAATKKTDEKKSAKDVPEENPAKTKACQDNSSATLTKKRVGVIDSDSDDDSKENSKVLANKAKEVSKDPPAKKSLNQNSRFWMKMVSPLLGKQQETPRSKGKAMWTLMNLTLRS